MARSPHPRPGNASLIFLSRTDRAAVRGERLRQEAKIDHQPPAPTAAVKKDGEERASEHGQHERNRPGDHPARASNDCWENEKKHRDGIIQNPGTKEESVTAIEPGAAVGTTSSNPERPWRKQCVFAAIW